MKRNRRTMKIKIEVDLKPFSVPNFILSEGHTVKTTDGEFIEKPKYRLKDLSSDTLITLCNKFVEDVFKKAGRTAPQLFK